MYEVAFFQVGNSSACAPTRYFQHLLPLQPNSVSVCQEWFTYRISCVAAIRGYNLMLQWDSDNNACKM